MTQYKDIFKAIAKGDIEAVKTFLPEQLEANGAYGMSPLHMACGLGFLDIANLLLGHGANIESIDNFGCTPFHYVCRRGNYEMAEFLVKHKANINAVDIKNWNPLHHANYQEHPIIAEFLVTLGTDPFALDKDGISALDYDVATIKDELGKEIPHSKILIKLREEYANKHALEASESTETLSSSCDCEMEL